MEKKAGLGKNNKERRTRLGKKQDWERRLEKKNNERRTRLGKKSKIWKEDWKRRLRKEKQDWEKEKLRNILLFHGYLKKK